MERVIEVRGIKKAFGDHEVLRGVDFAANKGEVTCIIGSSGSGGSGWPVVTLQNRQFRVQTLPRIIKVEVCFW